MIKLEDILDFQIHNCEENFNKFIDGKLIIEANVYSEAYEDYIDYIIFKYNHEYHFLNEEIDYKLSLEHREAFLDYFLKTNCFYNLDVKKIIEEGIEYHKINGFKNYQYDKEKNYGLKKNNAVFLIVIDS
jgi:hypothetical protein